MTRSRNMIRPRWTPDAIAVELVRTNFATSRTADLAEVLGVGYHQVAKLAMKLGLKKDPKWLNGPAGGRTDGSKGLGTRFQKQQKSWNSGKKLGPEWSKATQFKHGQKPFNYLPVGSLRIEAGGYLQIKMTDTGYPPRDWVMFHRHVWMQAHGPIPAGHMVIFRDGRRRTDPEEIRPEILDCISKQEQMRRHTFHQYGPEIAHAVLLRAAVTRQINAREKQAAEES